MNINHPILNTDSYKLSHYLQYPAEAKYISSYIEARGTTLPGVDVNLFFGLQIFIRDVLSIQITHEDIDYAESRILAHGLPFNREGWEHIVDNCDGYLPIEIKAIPEGSVVPVGTPLVQVMNTDPAVPWIVSYIETSLLRAIWYPTTVASMSFNDYRVIRSYYDATVGDQAGLEFMKHDFGARGVSSNESAAIGGLAHLASGFMGTDTLVALEYGKEYYGEDMAGFSVFATEHSTTTINGEDGELEFFERMIDYGLANPGTIVSMVADSYNVWRAVDQYIGVDLKDKIIALGEVGSRLVVRPDSGDPIEVPCTVVDKLITIFGAEYNDCGYKVLPDYIRAIQGDGINSQQLEEILRKLQAAGVASNNIVFGMGGGLLQKLDRDTFKFAMKCNAWSHDGENWIDVQKKPISGKKASKAGHITHVYVDGKYRTTDKLDTSWQPIDSENILKTVWKYQTFGKYIHSEYTTFDAVRKRAASY